jgi:hypothetical protein
LKATVALALVQQELLFDHLHILTYHGNQDPLRFGSSLFCALSVNRLSRSSFRRCCKSLAGPDACGALAQPIVVHFARVPWRHQNDPLPPNPQSPFPTSRSFGSNYCFCNDTYITGTISDTHRYRCSYCQHISCSRGSQFTRVPIYLLSRNEEN